MTTITERMKIDCLLSRISDPEAVQWMPVLGGLPILYFRCTECGHPIYPDARIEWDHVHATVHDGPNEYENLRPIHYVCHKAKTARDIAANAKVKRILADKPSRSPMKSSGRKIPSRKFVRRPTGPYL